MLFRYVNGQQQLCDNNKCRQIACDFDCHADAVVRCGAHCPMEHIPGFTRCHWTPPWIKCSHRIAAAAASVDDFGQKYETLTKTIFS